MAILMKDLAFPLHLIIADTDGSLPLPPTSLFLKEPDILLCSGIYSLQIDPARLQIPLLANDGLGMGVGSRPEHANVRGFWERSPAPKLCPR